MVITEGKKDRHPKTRLVKALVDSGASESIIKKEKSYKMPFNKTKQGATVVDSLAVYQVSFNC